MAGTAVTVSVRLAVPVPALLVALKIMVETPVAMGVPEIRPVAVFTPRPAGNPDAPKLVGKLAAVIWYENALPIVALAVPLLVITGGATITVSVSGALATPALLVAVTVTLKV